MDVLTEVLDSLRMTGTLYFPTEFTAPWGVDVPADSNVCRFHVITQGHCWIAVPSTGERRLLSQGDLALVPHGNRHLLLSDPAVPAQDLGQVLDATGYGGTGTLGWGGGGERARMVCGFFAFDREVVHPLVGGLPSIVHVASTPGYDFAWLDHLVRFLGTETAENLPGSEATVRRLSEVLFIQVMRYQAAHGSDAVPFLRTLVDERLGRSLRAIHREPGHGWTLGSLADEAGMSRTAYAERFAASMRMTAIQYLTLHRMHRARELLGADMPAERVAGLVGYQSEAAFSRRFKTHFGEGPGRYRRRALNRRRRARPSGPALG